MSTSIETSPYLGLSTKEVTVGGGTQLIGGLLQLRTGNTLNGALGS